MPAELVLTFTPFVEIPTEFVLIPALFVDIYCECSMMHYILTEIAASFVLMLLMFATMLAMFFDIIAVFDYTF